MRHDAGPGARRCGPRHATLKEWVEQGHPCVRELARIRDVDYVDLPTGHWPQFTRPEERGRAILASIGPG